MKVNFKDSKYSLPEVEYPVVNIRVNFFDDFRTIRTDEIVAQPEILLQFVDTFNMEDMKRSKFNTKRTYDTLMRLAFSPNLNMKKYCNAVLRYSCRSTDIKNYLVSNFHRDLYCCLNINVDRNTSSNGIAVEYNKLNYSDSFRLVGKLSSRVKMTLPSKFQFLSEEELSFMNHIHLLANSSGLSPLKLTTSELNKLLKEHFHVNDDFKFRELELFKKLISLHLINIYWNYEEPRFEITIFDFEHYNYLSVDVSNDQIDDLDFLRAV